MSGGAGILDGMRIIEGSAFVAAPLGGMTLAQMGADVIRFDLIGGGLDYGRWPLAPDGRSLFWAGMNKGKRSIEIDFRTSEGRQLVQDLITSPGKNAGMFLTNFPATGWLDYETLRVQRADLIMMALTGNHDGSSEVDYTVNPATGFPDITGPADGTDPVNSVLPAWDIALGSLSATGLLAAERHRHRTGNGQLVQASLSDVAFAMVGNLGRLAHAALNPNPTAGKDGNYLYGAFGAPFRTSDGRRVMVVGLTGRQWAALKKATHISKDDVAAIEKACGVDLDTESGRYQARTQIADHLVHWFERRTFDEATTQLTAENVSWGPYLNFRQLLDDPRTSPARNPMFSVVESGVQSYPASGSPLSFSEVERSGVTVPELGQHTDQVLADVLGLTDIEIARLHDRKVVA